jgi:2-oxo-4-hydroxy-4-carboxy--5-ureidoimidazoline (OHCU) decarboxylase
MAFFQNFLMKQMLKKQMKGVPEAEQEKIFTMIEKNPDFFQKIATEIQEKMKSGKPQMEATMEVMKANEEKMKEVMGK